MLYALTRYVQALILPPASLLILMLAGFLIVGKKRILGILCIASAFLLLYGACISPVSDAVIAPLEDAYPPLVETANINAEAIVVLSGGVRKAAIPGLESEPDAFSLERLVHGVALYRKLNIPLILVGGSGDPSKPEVNEADAMARTAISLGVPAEDIRIENNARNTLESAREMKRMLKGGRIVLVTSAFHMKRSVAFFKKQGFEVIPAPDGFRVEHRPLRAAAFIPGAGSLTSTAVALSEYISYQWYGMRGEL